MAHITTTITKALPHRRYSRPYVVTPSDVITDKNLQRDGVPFRWLQNCGADGMCMISWFDGTLVDIYVAKGIVIELGLPVHLMTTGTTAAGPFRGFVGIPGESEL